MSLNTNVRDLNNPSTRLWLTLMQVNSDALNAGTDRDITGLMMVEMGLAILAESRSAHQLAALIGREYLPKIERGEYAPSEMDKAPLASVAKN